MHPILTCMLKYANSKSNHIANVTNTSLYQDHISYLYDCLWYTFESKHDNHETHMQGHKGGWWENKATMNHVKEQRTKEGNMSQVALKPTPLNLSFNQEYGEINDQTP